jgi:hypothetical protein
MRELEVAMQSLINIRKPRVTCALKKQQRLTFPAEEDLSRASATWTTKAAQTKAKRKTTMTAFVMVGVVHNNQMRRFQ